MAILECHGTLRNARVPGLGHGHRHFSRRWLRAGAAEGADVASAGGEHLFDDSSSGGENAEVGKVNHFFLMVNYYISWEVGYYHGKSLGKM